MQDKAFVWATELVKNDFLAGILICVVGLIAFALFTAVSTFNFLASLRHASKSKQEQQQQAYNEANEALDALQDLGVNSRDISRARIGLDFHFKK